MKRREFVAGLAGTAAMMPLAAHAQQPKTPRVGFLALQKKPASLDAHSYGSFVRGLHELGYVEDRNLVLEWRFANEDYDRLPGLAAELVRLGVDVIVTHGTPGAIAAKQATSTIPIVMAVAGDAIAAGLVANLARPDGNVTGSTYFAPELNAKRLGLLKEADPDLRDVAALINPDNAAMAALLNAAEEAAASIHVVLHRFEVRKAEEFDGVFSAMSRGGLQTVSVFEDPMLNANRRLLAEAAARSKMIAIGQREFAEAGGLIGYGPNFSELYRHAAYFVDRLLKGVKPADLPVEQATKFALMINLRTARRIGVTVPPLLLARADEVIE